MNRKLVAFVLWTITAILLLMLTDRTLWAQPLPPPPAQPSAALALPNPFPELEQAINAEFYRAPVTWTDVDRPEWHFDYYWRMANSGVLLPNVPHRQLSLTEMLDPVGHNLVAEANRDHVRTVESILCLNNIGRVSIRPFTAACRLPNGHLFAVSNFACNEAGTFDLASIWPTNCAGHRVYTHETRTVSVRTDPIVTTDEIYGGYNRLLETRVQTTEQFLFLRQRMLARLHYVPPVDPAVYGQFIRSENRVMANLNEAQRRQIIADLPPPPPPPPPVMVDNPRTMRWLYLALVAFGVTLIALIVFIVKFTNIRRKLNALVEAAVQQVKNDYAAAKLQIANIQKDLEAMTEQAQTYASELNKWSDTNGLLELENADLKRQAVNAQSKIDPRVEELTREAVKFKGLYQELRDRLPMITAENSTFAKDLGDAQNWIRDLEIKLAERQRSEEAKDRRIRLLDTQITDLEGQIADLRARDHSGTRRIGVTIPPPPRTPTLRPGGQGLADDAPELDFGPAATDEPEGVGGG